MRRWWRWVWLKLVEMMILNDISCLVDECRRSNELAFEDRLTEAQAALKKVRRELRELVDG